MITTLADLGREASVAVRLLRRRPGFAAVLVVTLALGIGAPTAIFSVVHAVLIQPLPYPQPDRVVRFSMEGRGPAGRAVVFDAMPVATALAWRLESQTLSEISAFNDRALTLTTPDGPFRLTGLAVTPDLFNLLGVAPLTGRTFEARSADPRQIVLSQHTWQRYFGGRANAIGSPVRLDGEPYQVIGVMPDAFRFPSAEAAFWVPLVIDSNASRGMVLPVIARLKAGATLPAMLEEGRRLLEASEGSRAPFVLRAETLQDQLVGPVQRVLLVLMAAVGLVSAIGTANIALLLLVRGAARGREFSIRLAVGADRRRLLRQLCVEAGLLAGAGGLAGILLAAGLLGVLVRLAPTDIPRLSEAGLEPPVLVFAIALAAVSSLIFGALSAGRALAVDASRALAAGADRRIFSDRGPRRRLNGLAAVEVALTLVLLVGAGLLIRSLVGLVRIEHGFVPGDALALQMSLPPARYPSPAARLAFHERLLDRLRTLDDITEAGVAITMPNRQPSARLAFDPNGRPTPGDPSRFLVGEVRTVSEGFFEAMGIPLLAGRTFTAADREGAEQVIVIARAMATLHFQDANPVGRLLYSGDEVYRVIGVVGDVRPAVPVVQRTEAAYLPLRQDLGTLQWFAGLNIVVRGTDPAVLPDTMRALVLSMDPEMPPFNVRTLREEVSRQVAGPRFAASVLTAFAVVALILAAVGVYGVMAYSAGTRTQEVAVRVALGATRAQVLRLVLRDGALVVAVGVGAGLLAAAWLAQTLTGLLYEVQPADPVVLGSVAALLALTGLLAAGWPALRATRVNAVEVLRHE